jgi:predicted metalloprotease with PDZ domain
VSIAAHEFFHVVTPLSIHAEQIGNFDYNNPEMSAHLWLYEGVTEYSATHVQVNQKMIDPEAYLNRLRSYIIGAGKYNDTLPFTQMSKGALAQYADQYGNVYQKGALIGMAVDIKLRELSGGNYGLRNLMTDLARTYGKNQAFKDEELFDKITALTYPEMRDFFQKYVAGSQPLPYAALFKTVGVQYQPVVVEQTLSLGKIDVTYDKAAQKLTVSGTNAMNEFGRKMGYQVGDQLLSINKKALTPETAPAILKSEVYDRKEGDKITILVARKDKNGKTRNKKLKGRLVKTPVEKYHVLTIDPLATPQQKILQNAWLYSN